MTPLMEGILNIRLDLKNYLWLFIFKAITKKIEWKKINELISKSSSLDITDENGNTALYYGSLIRSSIPSFEIKLFNDFIFFSHWCETSKFGCNFSREKV